MHQRRYGSVKVLPKVFQHQRSPSELSPLPHANIISEPTSPIQNHRDIEQRLQSISSLVEDLEQHQLRYIDTVSAM